MGMCREHTFGEISTTHWPLSLFHSACQIYMRPASSLLTVEAGNEYDQHSNLNMWEYIMHERMGAQLKIAVWLRQTRSYVFITSEWKRSGQWFNEK